MDSHTEWMEEVLANYALVITCGCVMVAVGVGENIYSNRDSMLDTPVYIARVSDQLSTAMYDCELS